MKLAGEAQAELIKLVALAAVVGIAIYYGKQAANSAQSVVSQAVDEVASWPGRAMDAVGGAVATVIEPVTNTVAGIAAQAPGAGLPVGWYTVKTRWGDVVTRYPDSFKTINPYDTLGLIDP